MTRLLITGGLGLIGSEIAQQALARGMHVTIVDDGRSSAVAAVDGATTYTCPIEQFAPPVCEVDVVIHCAAPVGPVGILGRRVLHEMTTATEAAIDIARYHSAALIALSSSEVYGTVNPSGSLVVPDAWSHRTEYAVGKIVTEQMARRHHAETGLPTCIIRPWNVTGPRQSAAAGFVFPRMAQQARHGEPITVYKPCDQKRAFMAVSDFAALILGVPFERFGVLELLGTISQRDEWDATPIDAASPQNGVSMEQLAYLFAGHPSSHATKVVEIDPRVEHGETFREAAAGTKLPPAEPRLRGWTPLAEMVDAAMRAEIGLPSAA